MLRRNPSGHMPQVSETAFIDPTAIICGKVIIEDNVFIGPYAVIRADEVNEQGEMQAILIKRDTNIQDGVVIHSKAGASVTIGERSSIAHRCRIVVDTDLRQTDGRSYGASCPVSGLRVLEAGATAGDAIRESTGSEWRARPAGLMAG